MEIKELYDLLKGIAPTYPVVLPIDNKVYPAIVYTVVGADFETTICGSSPGYQRVQIDIYSPSYAEVSSIAKRVAKHIDAIRIDERDVYEPDAGDNPTQHLYRKILEFYI